MQQIKEYVANKKLEFKEKFGGDPLMKLAVVQVGDNPASTKYVRNKKKDCEEVGVEFKLLHFPEDVEEGEFLYAIDELNHDDSIAGFIVQLPLPKHIDEEKVKLAISPDKDADGFHPLSITDPATPRGIVDYLTDQGFEFKGKNAIVIGRSDIVGKPLARMLLKKDMNVTVLHSKTKEEDKWAFVKQADLIVAATGHTHLLTDKYEYKPSAVVVDVGINFDENGKMRGDCDPGLPVAFQSPVPGGVGLLTRLALLNNLAMLLKAKQGSEESE